MWFGAFKNLRANLKFDFKEVIWDQDRGMKLVDESTAVVAWDWP